MCTAYVDDSADDDADDEDENDGDDDDDDDDDDDNDDEDKVNVTLRSKFLWCVQAVGNPGEKAQVKMSLYVLLNPKNITTSTTSHNGPPLCKCTLS